MFVPHRLAEALALKDYTTWTSLLLFHIVLPRYMGETEWIKLCHQQGYGSNSHLKSANAQKKFAAASPGLVELANGGDKMVFYHFGCDDEYHELPAGMRGDSRLDRLAYAGFAMRWLQTTVDRRARKLSEGSLVKR